MTTPTPTGAATVTPEQVMLSPLISAKVLADSISGQGVRLTTLELIYPRFIHAELMTHRVFSRNASSSRAIPVARAIRMMQEQPAVPVEWRLNEPGMQGFQNADPVHALEAQRIWLSAMNEAVRHAQALDALGMHKQFVNRLTEPFAHIRVVLTSVYWNNWNVLRDDPGAEPTMQALAKAISAAREASTPRTLQMGQWHLPYVTDDEKARYPLDIQIKISAARCARVSYNNFDGKQSVLDDDIKLHDRLLVAQPIHASPAEHQATPDTHTEENGPWANPHLHGNLAGWQQYRKTLENENMDTVI